VLVTARLKDERSKHSEGNGVEESPKGNATYENVDWLFSRWLCTLIVA
jgi:hypothetical protein